MTLMTVVYANNGMVGVYYYGIFPKFEYQLYLTFIFIESECQLSPCQEREKAE